MNRFRTRIAIWCIFQVALLCIISCAPEKNSIKIGAISPFTGEGANYGNAARTGIDLALEEINARGGINGKKLTVIYEDDKGSPGDAISAFQKLASVDKVPAILGPFYSGNVLASVPEAQRLHVVLLTGSATSDNIRGAGKFIFRDCPSNDAQAKTIATFAREKLGFKTAFVIYRNVEYGVTLRDAFQKSFPNLGGKILGVEAVPADATDVRAQLTKAKATAPDFIFAAVHYPEGGALLRQAKELGIRAIIIGTDGGYDPQLIQIAGDAANGSYWATVGWADEGSNPVVAQFKEAYRRRYGEDPGVYSGLYYDATHVLANALVKANPLNGDELQKALTMSEWDGPTGLTKFNADGDVAKPFAMYQVNGGHFVPIQTTSKR
jgi:branched-chain amino acid transport system substrate-binding protein